MAGPKDRAMPTNLKPAEARLQQLNVLVVDDSPFMRAIVRNLLSSIGVRDVVEAGDGIVALERIRKHVPDVIILDISLPAGDGFLVSDRLQNMIGSAATPIIFITASDNPKLRARATQLGAAAFLQKPFDPTTLADAIESALSPTANCQPQAHRM